MLRRLMMAGVTSVSAVSWWPTHTSSSLALSNSDLTITNSGSAWHAALATLAREASTANHYFEVKFNSGLYLSVGINALSGASSNHEVGYDVAAYGYIYDGTKEHYTATAAYGSSFTGGDVLGVLLKNGKLYFRKNGVWQNSANVVAETGYAFSGLSGSYYPAAALYDNAAVATGRFSAADITGSLDGGAATWQ